MAVYTSYDLKPQYYTGAVSGCINGGEDYRTVGNKENIQDVNLMVNPQMSGLSNACTITNFKMSCQYRLTNTSNGSGLTLRGGFYWYPSFVENPTISGTSLTMGSNNLDPAGNVTFLADSILTINSERRGDTGYSSFSHEVQPSIGNLNGKNVLIGAHFAFQSLNSIASCRMWLKNVTFTITRTRACYIYWDTGVDGVGKVQTKYDYGVVPAYSGNLSKSGYTFKGWKSSNGTTYTGSLPTAGETDVTYTAVWELNTYTVKFVNYDGAVLQTVEVKHGNTPSYTGSTPTKASTAEYSYSFSGWSPSIGTVTSATTYTAQFTATKRKYTINVSAVNGSVSGGGTYDYGSTVTLTATPNTGYKFVKWNEDGNTSATRSITVTGNITYTAIFKLDKINKIYVGTSQPKEIYVGTTPVKAIYIGTTKIYG